MNFGKVNWLDEEEELR